MSRTRWVVRTPRALAVAVAATATALLVALWSGPTTFALFSDSSVVTTGALPSGSVGKPAAVGCTVSNPVLGTKSLTTTWTAASTPTALTYTAVVRETGQVLTVSSSGTQRSATVTSTLLGSLLGSTFHIDVTATLPGTSWTATSSRTGTLVLLGLGFSCGAWA